jgi:hypothetical protein
LGAIADLDETHGGDVTTLGEYEAAQRLLGLPAGETVERGETLGK